MIMKNDTIFNTKEGNYGRDAKSKKSSCFC